MRFTVVATITPFVLTMVSAGCYKGGDSGDTIRSIGLNGVTNFCLKNQGFYAGKQSRPGCISDATGTTRWYLEFSNLGSRGMTLDYKYCVESIKKEMTACTYGGKQTEGWWHFRADPEPGVCSDSEYINKHPNGEPARVKRGADLSASISEGADTVYDLKYFPSHEELHGPPSPNTISEKREEAGKVYDLDHFPSHEELHGLSTTRHDNEAVRRVPTAFQS